MKSKKIVIAVLAAVLLGTAVFAAAVGFRQPETKSGVYYRKLVDRMDITVENTAFALSWEENGDNAFELPLTLTLRKTEPDFYAKLLGVSVEGLSLDALEIADATGNGALTRDGVLLPAAAILPTIPKKKKKPMMPRMKRPQMTARTIFTKSFIVDVSISKRQI